MDGGVKPAPYPPSVRAKGWRFELDHERIKQSTTWAIARPEARPWLLMMWMTAWEQSPCGSLEADEDVIAARIGMPPKMWSKYRDVLMRGWWKADDGRLYHQTMTERVLEMSAKRRSESDRKAQQRAKTAGDSTASPVSVPRDKSGTGPESDTGTGTEYQKTKTQCGENGGTPPSPAREGNAEPDTSGHEPTRAWLACRAIKAAGVVDVNPGHPDLLRLLAGKVTVSELESTAAELAGKGKGRFALLLKTVEARRADAVAAGEVAQVAATAPGRAAAEATAVYLAELHAHPATKPPSAIKSLLQGLPR